MQVLHLWNYTLSIPGDRRRLFGSKLRLAGEDCRADAKDGCALLNRDFVV